MKTGLVCTLLLLLLCVTPSTRAGSFWYFDDLHYDPTYGTTDESCLEDKRPNPPQFKPLGSYYCDAPWALVEDAIVKMKNRMPVPNFIVWAGDTGHHPLTQTTVLNEASLFQAIKNVTTVLQREFSEIRVIPLLGNHDWLPKNKLPAQSVSGDLYNQYADLFLQEGWLSQAEATTFRKAGYFATKISDLKVLVLNTNYYLKKNTATSGDDPAGQFKFMRDQLEMAKQNGETVYIFTHVPIGNKFFRSPYDETFVKIITDYADQITSMHAAHEHLDRYRLIYKEGQESPVAYQIVTPAVTPWVGGRLYPRNPSFASFHYDDSTYALQDMRLYYLDLEKVTNDPTSQQWDLLYSFRDTYGKTINENTLQAILKQLKTNEAFFSQYYKRMWVNIGEFYLKGCDENCRKEELCLIEYPKNSDLEKCLSKEEDPADASTAYQVHSSHQMALVATAFVMIWHAI